MPVTTALSKFFKQELLKGNHDFDNDTLRVALIKKNADRSYNENMGSYTYLTGGAQFSGGTDNSLASDQATGAGYDSGSGTTFHTYSTGAIAALATTAPDGSARVYPYIVGSSGSYKAIVDFDDAVFQSVTVEAEGCVLYNSNMNATDNNVVATFDFGGNVSATAGDFTVQFPTADETNAIIRIA